MVKPEATIMKKSAKYIYPRPIARKRRSWRWALLVCVAAAAGLFFFRDDLVRVALFSSPKMMEMETARLRAHDPSDGAEQLAHAGEGAVAQALPAPAAEREPLSSHEIAQLAAAGEEQPERPGLLLATLADGITPLRSLPFFLPAPRDGADGEDSGAAGLAEDGEQARTAGLSSMDAAVSLMADMLQTRDDGPVVYAGNERYTVETDEQGRQIFRSVVAQGDTAGVLLNEWLNAGDVMSLIASAEPVCPLATIRTGRPFSVTRDAATGEFVRFVYEVDNTQRLVVERRDNTFTASAEPIEYDTQLVRVQGTINSSLFEAVADAGEGPVLAVNLADVFSCEINFINEIRQGDGFEVLVEKLYRDGEFKGYGKMLAARFANQGHTYEAYLFPDATGRLRHYNAKGEALQKTLLKAPLAFTRVSSGFSMNRKHPVFGYSRPHQGVDYAAPTGTPIKAVGDGVVTRAGWGNGYGNMIIIKHSGGLESQYAHMSGFARGIKSGVRVKQGQTIGYVGATGVATGPHLDFRLRQNGKFINPTKAIAPREDPVDKKRLPNFLQMVASAQAYMDGNTALAEYSPENWPR